MAYIVAHPACGAGEVWKAFCRADVEKGEHGGEDDAKIKWKGNVSDVKLVVSNHSTDTSVFLDGTADKVLGSWRNAPSSGGAVSKYITMFEQQKADLRIGSSPAVACGKTAEPATPAGPLNAHHLFTSPVSGTSASG